MTTAKVSTIGKILLTAILALSLFVGYISFAPNSTSAASGSASAWYCYNPRPGKGKTWWAVYPPQMNGSYGAAYQVLRADQYNIRTDGGYCYNQKTGARLY